MYCIRNRVVAKSQMILRLCLRRVSFEVLPLPAHATAFETTFPFSDNLTTIRFSVSTTPFFAARTK